MTTIQGFTPPPNHATMGVESTILDNLTPAPSDMSGQGEPDMSAKLKQRAVINGKVFWLTGSTQQELFQSYLSHAITEGVVVPPDENGQHRKDGLSTRFRILPSVGLRSTKSARCVKLCCICAMIRISRSPFRQIVACGSAFAQQSTSTAKRRIVSVIPSPHAPIAQAYRKKRCKAWAVGQI